MKEINKKEIKQQGSGGKLLLAQPLAPTRNSLPEKARMKLSAILSVQLLQAIDLFMQTKQAHWNVTGKNFKSVHELFDDVAEQSEEWADLLAERMRQLGTEAIGSAAAITQASGLAAYPTGISAASEHLTAVADRLAHFGKEIRSAIDECSKLGDANSADICTSISRAADKALWMVESHL